MQNRCHRKSALRLGVSVAALGLGMSLAAAAHAQTAAACPPNAEPQTERTEAVVDSVVVTGSRIDRAGFQAPTPTTVIGATELREGGRPNVAAVLNDLPQFRGTLNPSNTQTSTNNSGAQSADLRGLGASRTLVLLNGRRFVGDVDLNSIPFQLVDRVEVVTGGASAAYGSGAVAGVVNVLLNDKLLGGTLSAQGGVSGRGDGGEYRVSGIYGMDYAGGRGHLTLDAEYYDSDGITPRTARTNIGGYAVLANPTYTATNGQHAFVIAPNVSATNLSLGGLITTGLLAGRTFNSDGTLRPFNYGTLVGASRSTGGEGPINDSYVPLVVPVTRANLFGRTVFELNSNLRLSADLRYTKVFNHYDFAPDASNGDITISTANAFLPTAIKNQLQAAGQTSFRLGRYNNDFEFRDFKFYRQDVQGTIGLDGRLPKDWRFDAYYTHGEREIHQVVGQGRVVANFNQSVDSIISPTTGQPICRVALTNPTTACVPVNLFGFGNPSAAAANFINAPASFTTLQKLDVAQLNVRGEPISLWAGPVSVAFGGEYRKEHIETLDLDPVSKVKGFTTLNLAGLDGGFDVKEGYGEVLVPVLRDLPFAKLVEVDVAGRISDYSNSGQVEAWKVGVNYRVTDDLRLRFVRSRDTRSANLTELYTVAALTAATIFDPFTNSQRSVNTINGGNAALLPETSDTGTLGFVYSPHWAPGLSLSVDHYDIGIDGAISTLTGQDIVTRCFNGNTALCGLITRTAGVLTSIQTTFINLANYKTRGTDIETSYVLPLDRFTTVVPGALRFRGIVDHVESLRSSDGVTSVQSLGAVGTGLTFGVPEWRAVASVTYRTPMTSIDLRIRYVGGGQFNPAQDIANNDVSGQTYVDLSAEKSFRVLGGKEFSAFGSISNLFDKDPPIAGNPIFYDVVGRYFTFGLRAHF